MNRHLDKAINERGGYPAVADTIGVTRQTLYRWVKVRVPAERVIEINEITNIPKHVLRPDIFARS